MKRYLINGALALVAGLFITSCSHESEVDYTPIQDKKAQEFEQAFKEVFTKNIDPNQDWGYTPAYLLQASTRTADPRSNMWADLGYSIPVAITPTEKTLVVNHFSNQGEENYTSLVDLKEFFVQQVYKGVAEYTAGNGGKVVGGNQMDWLCAGSASMGDDHVNNFNNADGSVMLMVNSSTQRFGFKSSSDNGHVFYNFRMVDGADIDASLAGAYYVGLDFEANGTNPNEQVSRDLIYNDWIVKIIPGKGVNNNPDAPSTAYQENTITTKTEYFKKRTLKDYGRVFCEDLGGNYSNREDFDYNDVVFDANLWEEVEWKKVTVTTTTVTTTKTTIYELDSNGNVVQENGQNKVSRIEESSETSTTETSSTSRVEGVDPVYYAEICLIATGATLPVKVGGPNAIEVHKAFGDYSVDCMINTFDQYTSEVKKGFGYHEVAEPVRLDWIDVTSFMKTVKTISDIPVYVQWTGIEAETVTADKGSAPGRFTVRDKINWASERANFNVGYSAFANWAEGSTPDFWTGVDAHATGLYQGYPSPSAGLTFNSSQVNVETTLAVHRTTYETKTIEGIIVETDNLQTNTGGGTGDNTGESGSGSTVTSSYGTLWNTGLTLDGEYTHIITLNMTGCNAGDILVINYTHNHGDNDDGKIRVKSSDGWSLIYYSYTFVDDNSSSISITLTPEQAKKLNEEKCVNIDGEMLIINSIVLQAP